MSAKAHTQYLTFNTTEPYEMVHITPVEQIVRRGDIVDGLCFVSPMHITAAIYVNDHEDGLIEDIGVFDASVIYAISYAWTRLFDRRLAGVCVSGRLSSQCSELRKSEGADYGAQSCWNL